MRCEYCNIEHSGTYGSGRFCSSFCARGFSSRDKREEINKKVSAKLKKEPKEPKQYLKICRWCSKKFTTTNKNKKFCSQSCTGHHKKPGNGGPRDGGGKSKVHTYESKIAGKIKLNNDEIIVAKILDSLNLKWSRNNYKGFEYINLDGKKRKYYPDFYVEDFDAYIEYKGFVTHDMQYKMSQAQKLNKIKLLIIYSNDKRYKHLGLNLSQIQSNKFLLLEQLRVLV